MDLQTAGGDPTQLRNGPKVTASAAGLVLTSVSAAASPQGAEIVVRLAAAATMKKHCTSSGLESV
jgi:hypothetical protein